MICSMSNSYMICNTLSYVTPLHQLQRSNFTLIIITIITDNYSDNFLAQLGKQHLLPGVGAMRSMFTGTLSYSKLAQQSSPGHLVIRRNLTSIDVRFRRVMTVPALKGFMTTILFHTL